MWLIIIGVILLICILIALNSNTKNKQEQKEFRAEEARKVEEGKQESSNDETQGPVQDRDDKESGRYWSPGGEQSSVPPVPAYPSPPSHEQPPFPILNEENGKSTGNAGGFVLPGTQPLSCH